MGVRDWTILLSGAPQQVSSVLTDSTRGGKLDEAYRELTFSVDPNNANPVYLGASSAITATNHGAAIKSTATQPVYVGPYDGGPVKLSDFWVLGTAGERLHILGVTF